MLLINGQFRVRKRCNSYVCYNYLLLSLACEFEDTLYPYELINSKREIF